MRYEEDPSFISSYFALWISVVFLGVVAFVAAARGAATLAGYTSTILLLMVAVRFWGMLGLARLEVELSGGDDRLYPGDSFELRARIFNRKVLPVGMRLELGRAAALSPVGTDEVEGEAGLLPFETRSGSWTFRAGRRGLHRLGPVRIFAGDPLGLYRRGRLLAFERQVVVFPRRVELIRLELPFRDYFGIRAAKGIIEDPAWYEGTREYSGSTSARNIHWKASAHTGILQEKIFEPSSHQKLFFLFDGAGFETAEDHEGFESALETIGSLAADFSEEGASFGMATDRFVRGFPAILPLGRGPEHLGRVLELLARCEPGKGRDILSLLGDSGSEGAGFVLFAREPGEAMEKYRALPTSRRERVLFLFTREGE